jgi:hypothetical protein
MQVRQALLRSQSEVTELRRMYTEAVEAKGAIERAQEEQHRLWRAQIETKQREFQELQAHILQPRELDVMRRKVSHFCKACAHPPLSWSVLPRSSRSWKVRTAIVCVHFNRRSTRTAKRTHTPTARKQLDDFSSCTNQQRPRLHLRHLTGGAQGMCECVA